jgi:hypothetical protein
MMFLKETRSAGVQALKGVLMNGDLEKSQKNGHATISQDKTNPIILNLECSFSKSPFMPYPPSTSETETVFQSIEHIKLKLEFQLKNPSETPNISALDFFVNHELFFKIRKRCRIFDSDNFKTKVSYKFVK